MKPSNHCYRRPPCPQYDIPGTQRWLEEMAGEGWILEYDSFFLDYAQFRRDAPQTIRYRLEATCTQPSIFSDRYAPDDETREQYRQMGWDYQGRRGQFHIYAATDPEAPELHSDPEIHALSLKNLGRFLLKDLCWSLAWMCVYTHLFTGYLFWAALVVMPLFVLAAFAGLLGWYLFSRIWFLWKLYQYKKQMELLAQLTYQKPSKVQTWRRYLGRPFRALVWAVTLLTVATMWAEDLTGECAAALEAWDQSLPFATAADFYPEATAIEPGPSYIENRISFWSRYLAPENYECTQYVQVTLADGTQKTVYLNIRYHHVRKPWMAQGLAREAIAQASGTPIKRLLGMGQEVHALVLPGVETAAWYQEIRYHPSLIVAKGDVMMRIQFGSDLGKDFTMEELAQIALDALK